MCTLIFGRGVLGPGSLVLGANRDENAARPTEPPQVLASHPYVVGGRDLLSGGTWLAIRDGRAAVAILNRREPGWDGPPADNPALRSRGLLAVEVAVESRGDGAAFPSAAREVAERSLGQHRYAPFTLAVLAPDAGWILRAGGASLPSWTTPAPGWHVVTHRDIDDPTEPRTRRLLAALGTSGPATATAAEARLLALLGLHAEAQAGVPAGEPVCIHEGRMVTVSSSLFILTPDSSRYLHVEGRPCTSAPRDLTALIAAPRAARQEESA